MRKFLVFFLFQLLITLPALAANFIVTSNADAGPGTLRQALTDAAANGIAEKDYISFNIADVSETGRTIILKKQLPLVTSNLEIDASTQPGNTFDPGWAKIEITVDPTAYTQPTSATAAFIISRAKDVFIYGFYILGFYQLNVNIGNNTATNAAIIITGSQNVHIGAPGKGNTIKNTGYDIFADSYIAANTSIINSDLTIQANYIEATLDAYSKSGMLLNSDNVLLGGDTPAEGNHMATPLRGSLDNFKISHNINGIDGNGDITKYKLGAWQFTAGNLEISYNTSVRLNCELDNSTNFKIFGNVDTGTGYMGGVVAIIMANCTNGIIGSEDENLRNVFISNSGSSAEYITPAISNSASKNIQVLKNEIICSRLPYSSYTGSVPDASIPNIEVLVNNDTEYSGTASPLSDIYIYYDNTGCTVCSPVVFYAKAKADAAGNWKITGNFAGKRWVANALLLTTSSEFTEPYINDAVGYYKITQPSCGLNNGTLELINYKHVLKVEWFNASTNLKIGGGFKIANLAPGNYYAFLYNGNCPLKTSTDAHLADISPSIKDAAVDKRNASCGQSNGYIKGLSISNNSDNATQIIWTDQNKVTVSQLADADNLKAGAYTLTVTDKVTGCIKTYGPVTIINTTGPNVSQTNAIITPTKCGENKGSITNITTTGSGTLKYSWKNAQNQQVGTTLNLLNQPVGTYTLQVTDDTDCGPVYTSAIQIPELNGITIDYGGLTKVLKDATCSLKNGSIEIKFTDNPPVLPKSYRWVNHSSGLTVATTTIPILTGIDGGTYDVYVTNDTGCERFLIGYSINNQPGLTVVSNTVQVTDDNCGNGKGSVKGLGATGKTPLTFTWTDDNGKTLGTNPDLGNLTAGTYHIKITDGGGCEQGLVYTVNNVTSVIPPPNVSDLQVCSAGDAILSVISPQSQYTYRLYDSESSPMPLDAQPNGRFKINVKSDRTYYISQLSGTCESSRAGVKVGVGITTINIANTISPNGDGINDTWKINSIESYPNVNVQIFTRSGEKVFESVGYAAPFTGNYQGKQLPVGTYYYIINLHAGCNLLSGSLTLIR